jgi:pyruvate dehydrogenase E2 component (dihydrolipoyllysine-residue acetyltransferase)
VDIQMPQLGETVTEGTITRWLKSVGDHVEADEPLFEVSTDKVDSEVPAPASGTLSEIIVQEGETAEVGARLAVISDGARAAGAASAAATSAAPPPAAPEPTAPVRPTPPARTPPPLREPASPPPAARTPTLPPRATPPSAPTPPPRATPPSEPTPPPRATPPSEPTPPPRATAPPQPGPAAPAAPPGGQLMSPVVRRLLAEYGLDANDVTGSGEGGRITRNDVLDAAARRQAAPATSGTQPPASTLPPRTAPPPRATPPPAAPPRAPAPPSGPARPATQEPATAAPPAAQRSGDEVIPFDNIRRRTAEHMVMSKATSPHVYTSIEVDYERVDRARREAQEDWRIREGFPLTYLPFIVRAFCDTVDEYPFVNASVDGETLVVHHDVHVGIAVDLDFKGLIAPVIRDADGKRLRLIAREIHDLATRARSKQLMPDEIAGGTFTITNPGPWGTYMTLPIINQPQVAILSTDGIRKRPWVVTGPDGEDSLAIRHVGMLALTWDHRAFDGAYAAAFLQAMKDELQGRDWDAELA